MPSVRLRAALLLGALALLVSAPPGAAQATLEPVASFEHQVTGVTASRDGRVFVNFPRWTEDAPVSVAEVVDGRTRPYPDARWNSWRNARSGELSPRTRFVNVQSVVAHRGDLWVLDPAAPAMAQVVQGGPKLVRIGLGTDRVERVYRFGSRVAPQGSYLNDVRFSPDGRHAYITDSGARGAIVVVDLRTGAARRALDGHPTTQPERGVTIRADGRPLRRPDGRGVQTAADGIALSHDGRTLYWQALTGRTLYRVATRALEDDGLSRRELGRRVRRVGTNGPADGLLVDRRDDLLVTSFERDAVTVRRGDDDGLQGGADLEVLVQDPRLRWPDTLAETPDGDVLVTASRIQDSAFFAPAQGPSLPTALFRIRR